MGAIRHKIELKLNSTGFTGSDVDELIPPFMTDRKTQVGLTWYPSAEGPERFVLIITIFSAFDLVGKVFLEELSKDLFSWIKGQIQLLLKRKKCPYGLMRLKFNDIEIDFDTDGGEDWTALLDSLPAILSSLDSAKGHEMIIEKVGDEFKVAPFQKK